MNPDLTPPAVPEKAGPSNLRLRLIYGVLGAALLLGSVWYGPVTFGLFFAVVQAKMLHEFYRMVKAGGYAPAMWIGMGASLLFPLLVYFGLSLLALEQSMAPGLLQPEADVKGQFLTTLTAQQRSDDWAFVKYILGALLLLPVLLIINEIRRWPKAGKPFANIGSSLLGLLYVSMPMSLLGVISVDIRYGAYDYRRIFALFFLVWASDTGAYMAGKTFGKHKLAPNISPGKTWEGWAGGFLLTLVVGWALKFMLPDMPLSHLLTAAVVVAIFGPIGDLAESMLKRSVGVKDSGTIMPGHGGLLDRFDAFLLVLPVLALLQLLAGK